MFHYATSLPVMIFLRLLCIHWWSGTFHTLKKYRYSKMSEFDIFLAEDFLILPKRALLMQANFWWKENIIFSNPGTQTKIGRAMRILFILRFWSDSTEGSFTFLVLVRRHIFYIIWKLIHLALFWVVILNFWVPPSWPKMALNPKKTENILKINF